MDHTVESLLSAQRRTPDRRCIRIENKVELLTTQHLNAIWALESIICIYHILYNYGTTQLLIHRVTIQESESVQALSNLGR
jgi:hypothetical protein